MAHLGSMMEALQTSDAQFAVDVKALNNSGASGTVLFAVEGSTLSVMSVVTGLAPDELHVQHVHGTFDADGNPSDAAVPTPANDTDLDGFVEVAEGAAAYGDILLPLEDQSDGFNTDPIASPAGEIAFYEEFDLDDDSQFLNPLSGTQYTGDDLMPLNLREYVVHGAELTRAFGAGTEGSVDGTAGYKLTLPVGAGTIEEVSRETALDLLDDLVAEGGRGTPTGDVFEGFEDGQVIFGAAGFDTLETGMARADVTVETRADGRVAISDGSASAELSSVEKVSFTDGALLFGQGAGSEEVALLYAAALDRTPDEDGLLFWIENREDGMSLTDIATEFVEGDEFGETFGANLDDAAYVDVLYENVLGRPADGTGEAFWEDRLAEDGVSRADLLVEFALSGENRAQEAADIEDGLFVA